jgi:outer membrane protein assembly factor BamB
MRVFALLAVLMLAGCMDGSAAGNQLAIESKELALQWKSGAPTAIVVGSINGSPWNTRIDARPLVADVDGDGVSEIIIHSRDRMVRIFTLEGVPRGEIAVQYPPSWHLDAVLNQVAVGELQPDVRFLVVASPAAGVTAWRVTSAPGASPITFAEHWSIRADACHRNPGMDAGPVLANLDGKPGLEVLVHVEQNGLLAYSSDGALLWKHCWSGGNSAPVAADLDGDGKMEVVFASDSGFIAVVDGATGQPQWTFDTQAHGILPASVVTQPTVADLGQDGRMEVLFTARHAPFDDPDAYADFHMAVIAVRQNPVTWQTELLWLVQPEWANPMSATTLVVARETPDSEAGIYGLDWNTIGHFPGNWEPLGAAHAFRLDAQGDVVWMRNIESWWSNKDILVVDADRSGTLDVLVPGRVGNRDGIIRLASEDGKSEGFLTAGDWVLSTGAVKAPGGRLIVAAQLEGTDRAGVLIYNVGGDW